MKTNTYTRRKMRAVEKINALYQARFYDAPGISWGELAELQAEVERIARRAGLIREARENGLI